MSVFLSSPIKSAVLLFSPLLVIASPLAAQSAERSAGRASDAQMTMPDFADYEAHYGSAFSTTGAVTVQLRRFADGTKLNMIDIIPTPDAVIVATRNIDLATNRVEFEVGPYFAWGQEYVVRQFGDGGYAMTRIPLDGTAPIHSQGSLEHGGMMIDMFAPTLAAMLPRATGSQFELPLGSPRRDQTLASEQTSYEVIRRERLDIEPGLGCDCWVIRKTSGNGSIGDYWVSREAPFIYRWHRDIGGEREFVSDLVGYRLLER